MTILLRQKPLTQVVRQIVQRDNGAWFDPEDLSTMFQDAVGTTPVTAVGQPVGKILDKSGNGYHATQPITASRPTLIYEDGMYGLRFDGIDDYLNLPYMGLYANGSVSAVAGVYLQSKATTQYIIGETTSAPTNSRYGPLVIIANPPLLSTLIRSDSNVEFINSTNISDALQPLPSVTSVVDTGNSVSMRTKGVLVSTANYSRTSTLTANTTAVGALAQSTVKFFAQMNLYGLIITKSALTDAQRVRCERFLAQKSGVML